MDDLESVYDEKIAPLVQEIIEICKKENMPMFMEFQYNDTDFCRTVFTVGHPIFKHYSALSQCIDDGGVNIDKYMFWIVKKAETEGHGSLFLRRLDIPTTPIKEN